MLHGQPPVLLTGNLIVSRSIFEQAGGFEEALLRGEDTDFSWFVLEGGGCLSFLPDLNVLHRRRTSVTDFLSKRFWSSAALYFLNRRYRWVLATFGKREFSLQGELMGFLFKIRNRFKRVFLTDNGLSLYRKVAYFILSALGYAAVKLAEWLCWLLYDVLKRPTPLIRPRSFLNNRLHFVHQTNHVVDSEKISSYASRAH